MPSFNAFLKYPLLTVHWLGVAGGTVSRSEVVISGLLTGWRGRHTVPPSFPSRSVCLVVLICGFDGSLCGAMEVKPAELLLAEQHRAAIDTASIEFSLTADEGDANPEPGYFTTKFAGEDILYTYRGLADGRFNVESRPGEMFTYAELRWLMKDEEQWTYLEHTTSAHIKTAGIVWQPYYDIRNIGFEAAPVTAEVQDFWSRSPAERYQVERRDDAVEILGFWSNGFIVRFLLDPARAMQPTRVETIVEGEEAGLCETEYRQIKNFWFPSVSKYTYKGQVIATINVLYADFNEPYHPSSFGPEDLGLTPGIDAYREPSLGAYRWSGTGLISKEEWTLGVQEGKFDETAMKIMRANAHPDATTGAGRYPKDLDDGFLGLGAAVYRKPGLWEDFTRRFILFCKLNDEQTRKAWEVLRKYQGEAYERMPGIEKEAKEAEASLVALRTGGKVKKPTEVAGADAPLPADSKAAPSDPEAVPADHKGAPPPSSSPTGTAPPPSPPAGDATGEGAPADAADKARRIKALEERLDVLYQPIQTIFENHLKPGLNKLLTPQQQERVAKHDAEVKAKRAAEAAKK